MAQVLEPPKKEKRRIVPILIGPPTAAAPIPPPLAPAQEELLLEKQTRLLGAALVHKVATGRAELPDFEARVSMLNAQGGNWTVALLLEETGVKTTIQHDRHIKSWLDRWEPIALAEEEEAEARHRSRSAKRKARQRRPKPRKRSKSRRSRRRSRKPRRGRPPLAKASPTEYRSKDCLSYSVATSRAFARARSIPLGRGLRRKAQICAYLQRY